MACALCGRDYDAQQEGDADLCGPCWYEAYLFPCGWCGGYGERVDQHAYVVVWDAQAAGVPRPGLYRVTSLPYYEESLVGGGTLYRFGIEWLGFLPAMPAQDAPCGHLCAACQAHALDAIADHHTLCGMVATMRHV